MEKHNITITLPEEIFSQLKKKCSEEERSISNYVKRLLKNNL